MNVSSKLQILTTGANDAELWQQALMGLPLQKRDIHFTPEYSRIYERTFAVKARLALWRSGKDFILQPFVIRELNSLPFLCNDGAKRYFDIANVYGYGGPLSSLDDSDENSQTLMRSFLDAFHSYCRNEGFATEFMLLHPLVHNESLLRQVAPQQVTTLKPVIYMDLSKSPEELWNTLNRGHRSSINKSRRAGVKVLRMPASGEALEIFKSFYYETMKRVGAVDRWHFPDSYFSNCQACLGDEHLSLFTAFHDNTPIASYLIMHAFSDAYYHFGGSDTAHYELRANNLLMYEIALWAQREGYRRLHLGGGVERDDSLYRFKAGFSDCTATLFGYQRVHHEDIYKFLASRKEAHEEKQKIVPKDLNYFPIYRR